MLLVVKKKGDPVICGSIKAVSQVTGIPIDTLYYNISRKKKKRFTNDNFIIIKTDVIRAK